METEVLSAGGAMPGILLTFSIAFFLSIGLTLVIRRVARSRAWLDRPDGGRKAHASPVPRLGGVAVYLSFALSFLSISMLLRAQWRGASTLDASFQLLAACTLVMLVGVVDDLFGVTPHVKILFQVIAGLYLYFNGYDIVAISSPFGGMIRLGVLSLPITVLWFVGMSNAFNLIDGLDGLAAGVGLFAVSVVFILALLNGRWEIVFLAAALGGSLLGFLRYNFAPASIFLGDSGSLFVGFALAGLAIRGSMKGSTAVAVMAPLLALGVPILDTAIALVRRPLSGKSILEPDADHIHHRMLRKGLTPQQAVVILYGVAALFGALSLLTITGQGQATGLAAVVFTLVTWFGIRHLGYSQLSVHRPDAGPAGNPGGAAG